MGTLQLLETGLTTLVAIRVTCIRPLRGAINGIISLQVVTKSHEPPSERSFGGLIGGLM